MNEAQRHDISEHQSQDLEFTADEIHAAIDRMARARHDMSGEAFIEAVRTGAVHDECGGSADIVALVRLLPEGAYTLVR